MLLLGTDEAGYGPNLGPLVVAATVWQVPDGAPGTHVPPDLYERLSDVIAPRTAPRGRDASRLPVADSKQLYSPAGGIELLERSTLALADSLGLRPRTWMELWPMLAPRSRAVTQTAPWFESFDAPTPRACAAREIHASGERLREAFERTGCQLLAMRAAVVCPGEFNERVAAAGGKGVVLSQTTLSLIAELLDELPPQPTFIACDKHGGRNRYLDLLQRQWPDDLVEVREESSGVSCYGWGPRERRVRIEFRVGGESQVPCAAASMLAKYLRERAMEAFNHYWCALLPTLAPTAGYPVDAQRFRRDIATKQGELGIDNHILWREK